MTDRASLIQQVSAITGCNEFQAGLVLERSNWDTERAVNSFFDDPPPEVSIRAAYYFRLALSIADFEYF